MDASSLKYLFVLAVALCCCLPKTHAVGTAPASTFNYDMNNATFGPLGWQGMCNNGSQQSPINIITPDKHELDRMKYKMFYRDSTNCNEITQAFYVQNNGHSIQFEKVSNTSALDSPITITADWLHGTYNFSQLHFHWGENRENGSEHAVNDKKYPMELHIVHHKSIYPDLNSAIASNDNQAVAVMAVFYKIGHSNNSDLDGIIRVANQLQQPGPITAFNVTIKIGSLYPADDVQTVAVYNDSLTTPTCDERVIWTVFMETVEISETQMHAMRGVLNDADLKTTNFRSLQLLNNRTVEFHNAIMA